MVSAHPDIRGLVDWRPLARGGFSTVWQARQESLDRLVAVKVDHRPLSEDKERRRFLREAGAAGRLSGHAGIVTVHDAGILDDGRPFLVMDLCPGGSLTQWLKPEGRQSERRIRDVGVRIADALAAAHARGVLHRDVKPANILIDAYDHPGLADFGLAALPEPGVELSVTLEGMTPAYAPKEVFYLEPPTQFGDVYSLAATMYALLDGKPPRWPDTGTPSLPQLLELQREPIERLPQVDDEFMDVLLGALADEPHERPTAAQFRDQLAAVSFTSPAKPVSGAGGGAGAVAATPGGPATTGTAAPGSAAAAPAAPGSGAPAAVEDVQGGGPTGGHPSGPGTGSAPGGQPRPRRRRSLVAVLLAAVAVASVITAFVVDGRPPSGSAVPATSPTGQESASSGGSPSTPPRPANSPTASAASRTQEEQDPPPPDGFVDCSRQLGGKSYCVLPDEPECWVNYFGYADLNAVATMKDCNTYHEHQTFAAGILPVVVTRQSQFEARKEVKALCTRSTLRKVLASGRPLKDWQIERLPMQVQIEGDNLFRCLVGPARDRPHKLKVPRR